ncbi:hypothetical protein ACFY2H_35320 [Streptomyces griseofuscus]|uniref:hypothetical protein n=1 Tax=Streptomyces griseofuscus TaxID=146922 RepID=UPI0036A83DDA
MRLPAVAPDRQRSVRLRRPDRRLSQRRAPAPGHSTKTSATTTLWLPVYALAAALLTALGIWWVTRRTTTGTR